MHKVSVVIPTYKRSDTLMRAIESVRNQTYKNIEIIVVDDNDPDTEYRKITQTLMKDNYASSPNIKYIQHEKNKNGSAARNTGLRESVGEYISFLDDDDYYSPKFVEAQLNYLLSNPEYAGVYCGKTRRGQAIIPKHKGDLTVPYIKDEISIGTPALMFHKPAVLSINGFDESFSRHQDVEFLLRFFEKHKLGYVTDILLILGDNDGENVKTGKALDDLKKKFLDTFDEKLNKLELENKGIKKEVYSKNYAPTFLTHIRTGNIFRALKIYIRFLFYAPILFHKDLSSRVRAYFRVKKYKERKND